MLGLGTRDGEALPGPEGCGSLPAWATPEEKLGPRNRIHAVVYAFESGPASPGQG